MIQAAHDAMPAIRDVEQFRPRLFGIAYRMLGSVTDAEDAVQETYLRWQQVQLRDEVIVAPEGWLVAVLTRLCIDQLRAARTTREAYVGPWLPEPLVSNARINVDEVVEIEEAISLAFLIMLERLSPVERAVFLLHEVFGYAHAEIAAIIGKSEAACRQHLRRAKERIRLDRPKFQASAEIGERLAAEFLRACTDGDLPSLLTILTEDVELVADSGGKVAAPVRPIRGAAAVARLLVALIRRAPRDWTIARVTINGEPGFVAYDKDGEPIAAVALEVSESRVAAIRLIRNPDKLRVVPRPASPAP
jgi:RNA polymerase sigma-70 factor (ECF subfamily)